MDEQESTPELAGRVAGRIVRRHWQGVFRWMGILLALWFAYIIYDGVRANKEGRSQLLRK